MKRVPEEKPLLAAAMFALSLLFAGCPAGGPEDGLFVDAGYGSDSNPGTGAFPFKTITHAVAAAGPETTIYINPGTYDEANGEVFPIELLPGQQLIGDIPDKGNGAPATLVNGSGDDPDEDAVGYGYTFVGADNAAVSGLSISTSEDTYYFGIKLEDVSMEVGDNTFVDGYGGVRLAGTGDRAVRDNVLESTCYGVRSEAATGTNSIQDNEVTGNTRIPIEIVGGSETTVISGNTVTGLGQVGIQVSGYPRITGNTFDNGSGYEYGAISVIKTLTKPVIRNNTFQCELAILLRSLFGVDPNVDIGTQDDAGNNDFSAVTACSIRTESGVSTTIYAIGNAFPNNPPQETADIDIQDDPTKENDTATVYWGTEPGDYFD